MGEEMLFFSIVIPAYNEEKYIGTTLTALKQLEYPPDRFEVIVVDNGSTDGTERVIAANAPASAKVVHIEEPGVSRARNRGIDLLSEASDWVIFLDADTYFAPTFLTELNRFLRAHAGSNLGTGMVSLRPAPDSRVARGWYHFYNSISYMTRTTKSIQFVRRDLLREIRYDESLTFSEDVQLLMACRRRHTHHFYLRSTSVFSSTRRFVLHGWLREPLTSIWLLLLPYRKKKSIHYPTPR
ncbi:MAG: glycosyltransferase family A protein [Candidatus Cryosericum sp.]|nr:glycosyltransferase family 2 protein [bacterium]